MQVIGPAKFPRTCKQGKTGKRDHDYRGRCLPTNYCPLSDAEVEEGAEEPTLLLVDPALADATDT